MRRTVSRYSCNLSEFGANRMVGQILFVVFMNLLLSSVAQVGPTFIRMEIISNIKFRYAKTHVITEFYNSGRSKLPVNFTQPLPEDALITGFQMTIGTEHYEGVIMDIDDAENAYYNADKIELPAGLIKIRDASTFHVSVKVAPQRKATFNWTYEQILKRQDGLFNLPVHVNPGQALEKLYVEVNIYESSLITNLKVSDLHNYKVVNFKSNTNADVYEMQNTAKITWNPTKRQQQQKNIFNGLIDVYYDTASSNEILLDSDGNFVHTFKPDRNDHLKQYVTFILDVSGSMKGEKLEQLKKGMKSILDDLHRDDKFTIIYFSHLIKIWSGSIECNFISTKRPLPNSTVLRATDKNIELAKKCVDRAEARGGTYIYEALNKGIEAAKIVQKENSLQVDQFCLTIVFLTDGKPNGLVYDPMAITNEFTNKNSAVGTSLFSLAFGITPDFTFLKKLSLRNKGFAKRIYNSDDAAKQLEKFYGSISSPQLSNIQFSYDNQVNQTTKTEFPVFYKGQNLLVSGNVPSGNSVTAIVKADQISSQAELIMVDGEAATFLKRIQQFAKIKELLNDNGQYDITAKNLALREGFIIPTTGLYVQGVKNIAVGNIQKGRFIVNVSEVIGNDTAIEENTFTGHGLSDIEWLDSVRNGSYITLNVKNTTKNFLVGQNQNLTKFESCTTPTQKPGHCYHLYQCVFPEVENDINIFLNYLCSIEDRFLGICCPDEMTLGYE